MLSRTLACVLIVLVVAPFTAPFPTCDLMALIGGSRPVQAAPSTVAQMRSRRAASRRLRGGDEATARPAFAAIAAGRSGSPPHPPRSTARTDDVTVPGLFVTSTFARSRLPHFGRTPSLSTVVSHHPATTSSAAGRSTTQTISTPQSTILRV